MFMKTIYKTIIPMLGLFAFSQTSQAQRYNLFPPEVKTEYPSVVYDFLERYLFEIDSLRMKGEFVDQRLRDDKVVFLAGSAATAKKINQDISFNINTTENHYYEVSWSDSLGNVILDVAFPMQYELLLGKPKVEIEKDFKSTITEERSYVPTRLSNEKLNKIDDGCMMTSPISNYYVESLNTATYYKTSASGVAAPTFLDEDKWHSAANLFLGRIDDISDYTLFIEQNLYGFNKIHYTVTLQQWLAYCQAMKLQIYFAIEEEREDGLKALLIAQSSDLGFNHMMSIIIPDHFVTNKKTVFKATLNAYIPTQNVKDLYKQYIDKPKKRI